MDRQLAQQLKEGRIDALKDLYESFFPVLVDKAREIGIPMHASAGLINQLFLEFWNKQGKLDSGESPLDFFQRGILEYREAMDEQILPNHWIRKKLGSLDADEQNLIKKIVLDEGKLHALAKEEGMSEEELQDKLMTSLRKLALLKPPTN